MSNTQEQHASLTVAFRTLGCKSNQLESSALADEFRRQGWEVVPFSRKASLYVINTCTVTADSDSESRRIIRQVKRLNPASRIAVTGCYAQVSPDEIAAIEGVNYVIGNNFKQDVFRIVQQESEGNAPIIQVSEIDKSRILAGAAASAINRTRASLKIQDGCDYKCTYCIIWVARGPSRSLPLSLLKRQLQDLAEQGYHEVVLTGVNIGQYCDPETGGDLTELLGELVRLPGTFRLRLSSLDPVDVKPPLLDLMASTEKLCPYFHLSVQSAQDDVLKRMARRHRVADLYGVCEAIQRKIPGAAIGADLIAGFPGESAERFAETYQVLSDLPMSYFHSFAYSRRSGTPAADFPDPVAEPEKRERVNRLIVLSEAKNLRYRQSCLGSLVRVIIEEKGDRGMSENFVRVTMDRADFPQNSLVTARIVNVTQTETWGQVQAS